MQKKRLEVRPKGERAKAASFPTCSSHFAPLHQLVPPALLCSLPPPFLTATLIGETAHTSGQRPIVTEVSLFVV